MSNEINKLKTTMAELKTDISYIKKSLDTNDAQHKEIIDKIDGLAETMTNKIQDKADHKETVSSIRELDKKYVSKEAFGPIQKVVYGMVGAMLLAIIAGIMALILRKPIL